MHDINFIRENPDLFDELLKKRNITSKSSEIISLDADKRSILTKSQELRAERKSFSSSFSKLNESEKSDLQKKVQLIKNEIDEIENKTPFVEILENAAKAKGVQIFIGSKNFLFKHSGLSMVMAPYKNKEQEIVGAIGVVGPTRLNYSKIVPLVDYTSKIIGKVLK